MVSQYSSMDASPHMVYFYGHPAFLNGCITTHDIFLWSASIPQWMHHHTWSISMVTQYSSMDASPHMIYFYGHPVFLNGSITTHGLFLWSPSIPQWMHHHTCSMVTQYSSM